MRALPDTPPSPNVHRCYHPFPPAYSHAAQRGDSTPLSYMLAPMHPCYVNDRKHRERTPAMDAPTYLYCGLYRNPSRAYLYSRAMGTAPPSEDKGKATLSSGLTITLPLV